jgi:hypothetical protein
MTDTVTSQNIDLSSWDTLYTLFMLAVYTVHVYATVVGPVCKGKVHTIPGHEGPEVE